METSTADSADTQQEFPLDAKCRQVRPDLVAVVKRPSFSPSGVFLGRDEQLCRAVCRDLMLGLSGRKVAKKYGISRNSILAIEQVLRDRGELEPLRQEVMRLLDGFIYLGLERITEAIGEDEIHPGQLPIPVLAAMDKKAQLEHGIVLGTQRTIAEVTSEDVKVAWEKMKRVANGQSAIEVRDSKELRGPDTVVDTSQAAGQEGGGGSAVRPGGPGAGPNGSQNLG